LLLTLGGCHSWLLILRGRDKRTAEKHQRAAGRQQSCRCVERAFAVASASGNAISSVMHLSTPFAIVRNLARNL
jgi:hypothetical protein